MEIYSIEISSLYDREFIMCDYVNYFFDWFVWYIFNNGY